MRMIRCPQQSACDILCAMPIAHQIVTQFRRLADYPTELQR